MKNWSIASLVIVGAAAVLTLIFFIELLLALLKPLFTLLGGE